MTNPADPAVAHDPLAQDPLAQEFVAFAVQAGVLRFGEFKTKAGRLSPYFFNAGLFCDGTKLLKLAEFYARRLLADGWLGAPGDANGPRFDLLFGPAYKGITLASAVAVELARLGHHVPFAYNRKEAKDHGEGGTLVGAPVVGRVLIIDDVISAGTSVRESVTLIEAAGAKPCGVTIALDRQERATDGTTGGAGSAGAPHSAVQYVTQHLHLQVSAIATLQDLLQYLRSGHNASLSAHAGPVQAYRDKYGV
jgi:orotate phosphoribosyltransferase